MKLLWVFTAMLFVSSCFAVDKPRVFITDSQSWEMSAASGGSNGTFAGHASGGARPQTAEIIKTFGERCPDVLVNNKQEKADYIVVLDHEGGKGLLRRRNKVAVFNRDGDAILSRSTRSLGNSVQDACEEIAKTWSGRAEVTPEKQTSSVSQPPPAQALTANPVETTKKESEKPRVPTQAPAVVPTPTAHQISVAQASGAAASVQLPSFETEGAASITSTPDGAEIFVDSVGHGHAPTLLKLKPGKHQVQIVLQGYKDWLMDVEVKADSIVNVTAKLEK